MEEALNDLERASNPEYHTSRNVIQNHMRAEHTELSAEDNELEVISQNVDDKIPNGLQIKMDLFGAKLNKLLTPLRLWWKPP